MEKTYAFMKPADARSIIRKGEWKEHTPELCIDYAKFNLAVVPKEIAFEFLLFCQRNPACAYVSEVTDPGNPHPKFLAAEVDLRTDLPGYRVFRDGEIIDEPADVTKYWRDDLVAFLIGSADALMSSLIKANVRYRFLGGYKSNIPSVPAGRFRCAYILVGIMLGSIHDAERAIQISSRLPIAHFAPLQIGDPTSVGIRDIYAPDWHFPKPILRWRQVRSLCSGVMHVLCREQLWRLKYLS